MTLPAPVTPWRDTSSPPCSWNQPGASRTGATGPPESLEEQGPVLPFPYSSQIRGKLRELRTQYGKDHYRVLYFGAPGRTFVLLHAFTKRVPVTPEREIALAERRMAAYLESRRAPGKGGNRHEA